MVLVKINPYGIIASSKEVDDAGIGSSYGATRIANNTATDIRKALAQKGASGAEKTDSF